MQSEVCSTHCPPIQPFLSLNFAANVYLSKYIKLIIMTGKIFHKLSFDITMAVKLGGVDKHLNSRLTKAIEEARV